MYCIEKCVCCFTLHYKYIQVSYFFKLTDVTEHGVTIETHPLHNALVLEEPAETSTNDSDRTVSVSGSGSVSTDSDRTPVRVDSQDSQVSDSETITDRDTHRWPRQNSVCVVFDQSELTDVLIYRLRWFSIL